MGLLPSAKNIMSEEFGSFEAMYKNVYAASSGFAIIRSEEENFLVVVEEGENGDVISYSKFHITVQGQPPVNYSFSDVLSVTFAPGKPAFIACLCVAGLCVLAGITFILSLKIKSFKKKKQGV